MARKSILQQRAERLRTLAASAENISDLAVFADDTLAKVRRDVLSMAAAARTLADKLSTEAGAK